ncbi:MAG TPA: histidine kinase [Terriglobales bacterium]|nr:histidine kinase [Terriglobales bacterium]
MRRSISRERAGSEIIPCTLPSIHCICWPEFLTRGDTTLMQTESQAERRSLRQSWKWIAVLWMGFALVNATQIVAGMRAVGMQHAWSRLFFTVLASWIVWALATPLVLLLGRRFPPTQWRSVRMWSIHFAACVTIGAIYSLWGAALQMALQPWGTVQVNEFGKTAFYVFYGEFHLFLILYAAILAVDYTLESTRRLAQSETEAARLNEQLSRAQLDALRRQLEPHFFFNTLNAIAGLVRENRNDDAVSMIASLGDLLRRVLDDSSKQEVSLGEEMEYLETYLDIQKTRFADHLQLSVNVPREFLSARVPSLILQPMVENAIEHGIGKRAAGGAIRIAAARDNGLLTLSVYNEGPAIPDDWEQRRSGVGISNVRARLQSLYGSASRLNIQNRDGGVEVQLSVPYKAKAT